VKGWRFLREKKDTIQAGDEMRVPWRNPKWEAVGPHVFGMKYTRNFCKMTLRRRTQNSTPQRMARSSAGATYAGGDGSGRIESKGE
jgi:hypothetical protein